MPVLADSYFIPPDQHEQADIQKTFDPKSSGNANPKLAKPALRAFHPSHSRSLADISDNAF